MNLPNYFLADLPPGAELAPSMILDACHTLKRNRQQYLASRGTQQIIQVLSQTAGNWLSPGYPFREWALEHGPAATGFPRAILGRGLDAFFITLTKDILHDLILQEFGHAHRLDGMTSGAAESRGQRASMVCGPELLVHVAAGNIPSPTLSSIVSGLLLRSAQFIKCASGASFIPRLFAHSLYEADPKLAACLEVAEWRGGHRALEQPLFGEAGLVTATGSDETLEKIRGSLPPGVRFVGYGHRVSFGFVTRERLNIGSLDQLVRDAIDDVVAWNQQGCLSPHVLYAATGGAVAPEQLAEKLAAELARRETAEPRGPLPVADAASIASRRDLHRLRAATSPETRLWCSENSTAWTVVYEADPRFQFSCLNRFLYVKPAADLAEVLRHADPVRRSVSTVGLAADADQARELARQLAGWGVTRVCPIGRMQHPPAGWRHDGRPPLADLVSWTDWEQ